MKFLDRKEQVLELQMTQYGKALMSRGVFQPAYYAFFDDDVVYDSEYMSTGGDTTATSIALESSVTTSDRIRDAIRPEPQYNYAGIETNINRLQKEFTFVTVQDGALSPEYWTVATADELPLEEKLSLLSNAPSPVDNYYSLGLPMGTSEYNTSKAPAWKLNFHNGEITNLESEQGVEFFTGSGGLLKIPQLEVEAIYDVYIQAANSTQALAKIEDSYKKSGKADIYTFGNSLSYIKVEKDHILVDVGELNSIFQNENFDIEVYEIQTGPEWVGSDIGIQENLIPLYFMNKTQEGEQLYNSSIAEMGQETTSNVEYYFEIRVDDEIDDSVGFGGAPGVYNTPPNDKEPC